MIGEMNMKELFY